MNEANQPLRLRRQSGNWTLEVTKLVPIDRHVLRPERRQVSGTDSVVRHLKERCSPSLVREALDLIVEDDDGYDRAFELDGDHWIQLSEEERPDQAPSHATLAAMVNELRAELITMRALHEAMRGRLALLERRALQSPPQGDYSRGAPRVVARREPGASLRPTARTRSLLPAPDVLAPVPLAEQRTQAAVAAPVPAAAREESALNGAATETAAVPELAMPTPADVSTCLKQLLGTDPELRQEKNQPPRDLDAFYVSRIVDANDKEVGAILLDSPGGAELGGRLLGLPAATIAEQAKGELSADTLDAMNEVVNNLGGFVNRANPELRTRVKPLEKFSAAEFGWLAKSAGRVGCTTKTGGRLWLAAR